MSAQKYQEEEKQTIVADNTTDGAPKTYGQSYLDQYGSLLTSAGDDVKAHQEAAAQSAQKYQDAMDNVAKVREKHGIFVRDLVEEQKPVYDEERDKKLRNRAMIQSLGDMLNAATRGYFAYRDKGAGVVPKIADNSPLKNLEEINRMQEEYRKRREAWKTLDMTLRKGEEDAKLAAAEAVAEAAATQYKDDIKRRDDAVKDYNTLVGKTIDAGYKVNKDATDANFKQQGLEIQAQRAAAAMLNATKNNNSSEVKRGKATPDEIIVSNIVWALYGDELRDALAKESESTESTEDYVGLTTTKKEYVNKYSMTDDQRRALYYQFINDPRVQLLILANDAGADIDSLSRVVRSMSDADVNNALVTISADPKISVLDLIK